MSGSSTAHHGTVRLHTLERQSTQAHCLHLVANAVVYWNTIYTQLALDDLSRVPADFLDLADGRARLVLDRSGNPRRGNEPAALSLLTSTNSCSTPPAFFWVIGTLPAATVTLSGANL